MTDSIDIHADPWPEHLPLAEQRYLAARNLWVRVHPKATAEELEAALGRIAEECGAPG